MGQGHTPAARGLRVAIIAAACSVAASALHAEGHKSAVPCRFATGEKLGIGFYRVCPSSPDRPPFWISAPLTCGQGEHGTVLCPEVTALVRAVGLENGGAIAPRRAAMVDAFTAHRLCGMRFGGRLASGAQRSDARETLGLATLLVTQGRDTSGGLWLTELPEWIAEGKCDNPSMLGAKCRITTFPPAPLPLPLAWEALRACTAEPLGEAPAGREVSELGQDCAGTLATSEPPGRDRAGSTNACLLRDPGPLRGAYALRCDKPASTPHAPTARESTAAVRCVVAGSALGHIDEQPRAR
jgi:hypothetical protein